VLLRYKNTDYMNLKREIEIEHFLFISTL